MTPPGSAEPSAPVGLEDVEAAARRIYAAAVHTPLLSLPPLDELIGTRVRLKMESMQRAGAFKFRGACNAVALLPECTRGVVTFSSGNHAAALTLAARLAGLPAVVVMPDDTQPAKVALAGRYGAEIVTYDRFDDDRDAIVATLVAERRLTFVPPFDDPGIIAGQGTAALEMLAEGPGSTPQQFADLVAPRQQPGTDA
jgi:threonine dehydratase